jgi:hypothetical protein
LVAARAAALRFFVGATIALAEVACTSVGHVTSLGDPACAMEFEVQLGSILVDQGERPEVAIQLASQSRRALALGNFGPRPFLVSSSSGTDYSFFVQAASSGCLLRLYGRQKGFMTYTNDLTYIATRPVMTCTCAE